MNISQHCFVPRGREIENGYYTLGGTLSSTSNICTTEKQKGDIYNCFQLFGSNMPYSGTWYALRLFNRVDGSTSQGGNYVGSSSNSGYVSPTLRKTVGYAGSAYTYYRYPNGFPVVCVMWYETPSLVLNMLNLGNTFNPDVINEEEAI